MSPVLRILHLFPVDTDSITNNAQEQTSQSSHYSTTQPSTDPSEVSHQSAEESEQAPMVTVSMGKDLMSSLHGSIIKCMQIQNSLHKLVLLKLGQKAARSEGHRDTGSNRLETSHAESSDDPRDLLCELNDPLVGLMGSTEIQRSFFQRLITLNSMITGESADSSNNSSSPGTDTDVCVCS